LDYWKGKTGFQDATGAGTYSERECAAEAGTHKSKRKHGGGGKVKGKKRIRKMNKTDRKRGQDDDWYDEGKYQLVKQKRKRGIIKRKDRGKRYSLEKTGDHDNGTRPNHAGLLERTDSQQEGRYKKGEK